jgi:parallel beta-helix repeat protein
MGNTINLRNFNLAQDWWKASILISLVIVSLFAAGWAASQGATVSYNVEIQAKIEAEIQYIQDRLDTPVNSSLSGLQKPFTEIIAMVDSYYCRQNGTDARLILPYSTNKTYIEQQSIGNVTTGSIYLKEMTLASGLTYGSTVLIIQQYQGQLSYYSNSALIYTVKAGSLNATVIYAATLNASTNYIQAYRLLVENGTSFPSSPSSGYIFFRTDLNAIYFYNGTDWTACAIGGASEDDDSMYLLTSSASNFLFQNGTRALTANWNTGAYGIYGATWLNSTNINLSGNLYFNQGQAINMTLWSGTSFPASPVVGQPFYRTDLGALYYYNGTWVATGTGATGPAGASGTVLGLPFSFLVFINTTATYMLNGTDGTIPYSSTNASVLIKNAINNASAIKGSVFIKAGNYPISPNIDANFNNTLIMGEGIGTRLYLPNDQPHGGSGDYAYHQVFAIVNCENVTIQNLCIDGNYLNNDWVTGQKSLLQIRNSHYVTIQNCWVLNGRTFGISIQAYSGEESYGVKVLNNILRKTMWNPIETLSYGGVVHNCLIQGNVITEFCDIGIAAPNDNVQNSKEISIINNVIFGNATGYGSETPNGGWGIRLEAGIRCTISGNTVSQCNRGYGDSAGGYNLVTGNTFQMNNTNALNGMEIWTSNNTITNNYIYEDVGTNWPAGIFLYTTAGNNLIENNFIFNEAGASQITGIQENGSPVGNVIRNNKILGMTSDVIVFTGTGQVCSGNIGYNPLGYIASWHTGLGTVIVDSGNNATIQSATTYTCAQSPKVIYLTAGTVTAIIVNGQTIAAVATTISIPLQPGDTFSVTFAVAPTIKVFGQ